MIVTKINKIWRLFGHVRLPLYVHTRLSNLMVGSQTPTLSAELNRIETEKAKLAGILALLMLTALAAPSLLSLSA